MSRKVAIIVLASVTLAIGLAVLISNIPFTKIDPESMPSGSLQYVDQDKSKKTEDLYLSGYHWQVKDPASGEKMWDSTDQSNFFFRKNGVNQILPGDMEITMQLVWLEPPNNIIIKRWPLSEWTPDDSDASHSQGVDVVSSWKTHWEKTDISFDVERGSLYGVWIYYGNAWVEYSFIVPGEDPITYDYLGYFSGFNNPNAQEFTMDPIEWIDSSNADRIKALNLNQYDDFPSGFYIYNPTIEAMPLRLTDQTKYFIIDLETGPTPMAVDRNDFLDYLNQFPDVVETTLFWVEETDGNVEFIKVHYVSGEQ